jgi:hypothetical protein
MQRWWILPKRKAADRIVLDFPDEEKDVEGLGWKRNVDTL